MWKPISQYPTTPGDQGPIVLARTKEKEPFLVVYVEGQFYECPASPIYYGNRQWGNRTVSGLVEFMEIPA